MGALGGALQAFVGTLTRPRRTFGALERGALWLVVKGSRLQEDVEGGRPP